MGPIHNVYGVMGVFRQMRSCEKRNACHYVTLNQLGQEQSVAAVTPNSYSSQMSAS